MADSILITYATRTGSTKGISDFMVKTLSNLGEQVEILPIQAVRDLTAYKAIILGSAIQASKLMPEVIEFVKDNRNELSKKPFAVFLVCVTLAMRNGKKYHSFVSGWLDPIRSDLNPISEGFFSGVLDIKKIPSRLDRLKFRLSVLFGFWKEGDHRDWSAIQHWTEELKSDIDKKLNK